MLRIRDMLARIRTFEALTNGSCYFRQRHSRRQQKLFIFLQIFFCLLLFEGTFTSFFEVKSHKEFTKQ